MAAVASKPNFAVVCSFLERYGASLELPEFTFPELEDALENKKAVPQPLVDLQLKLMRKIGKSVSIDRWEKYLLRICLEYNNTWAWEMEKIGYTEMDAECKLGLLKYLCECQFDDNLKFKNVLNEEEPDAMRIHPLGCDKDGLMYWYQLDQELNVRLYTEEQDDQDGTSWKLIVRDRNELAETLQLLKGQIDPALLTKLIQEEVSIRTSPAPEDEDCKKELEEHGREEMKIDGGLGKQQNKLETVVESKPALPVASTSPEEDNKKAHSVIKQLVGGGVKTELPVKVEPALEKNSEKAAVAKLTKDGNLERVASGEEGRASRGEVVNRRSSGDGKACSARLTGVECEKLEISIKVEPIDGIKEKSSEELERALRNVKQAKLPVKKREIKLAKDYDSGVKGPVGKPVAPVTPVNELLREGLRVAVEAGRPPAAEEDGKQLVNGEVPPANRHRAGEDKAGASAPSKTEEPKNGQGPEATRPAKKEEENGIDGPGAKGDASAASAARENHASVIKIKVSQNCVAKEKGAEPGLLELRKSADQTRSKCEDEDSSKCSIDTNLSDKTLPDKKRADCPKGVEEGCGDKVPLRKTRTSLKPQSLAEKGPAEDAPEKVEQMEEEQSEVRCLRRSLRISKPTIKVTENQEKRASKKEDASAAQSPSKDESQGKVEKDSSLSRGTKRKAKANRRARWTKSRGRRRQEESSEESESDQDDEEADEAGEGKPAEDDEPCKKCGLSNHPELILLCDFCDSGYHTACLRPPLMTIPDGEWFCPPCQHKFLCDKLEERLENIDMMIKKKERAERRKERLAFVGINVENIITPKDLVPEEPEIKDLKSLDRRSGRTRRSINYRFDEFDDAIDEAIHEDIQEAEGKGQNHVHFLKVFHV
ncbi:remodeling and spacing factor 1 [Amblyraja radiata]|uniref:remodeling and spacing factor 1 n=1 Tax=Amblyraja radiata TaxID=386614 RepID=UPI0014023079|nr:remodeling and spacing factor 1 [Amblyraja radiata]